MTTAVVAAAAVSRAAMTTVVVASAAVSHAALTIAIRSDNL